MKKKIIYVEDCQDTANAVKIILEKEGYNVDLAYTGGEGIEKLKIKDYDLAILDIMLPDMTGVELFEQAVKVKPASKCKYVFLSIVTLSMEQLDELKKKGLSAHIKKPFRREEILKIIKGIVA